MSHPLHATAALEFVREHGVEAILGEPIIGNWWAHPKGSFIFNVLSEVSDSEDVLVCRLLQGKITLVHRRLWPALVCLAARFEPARIAQVRDEHTPSGRHVTREVAFPLWVPSAVRDQATLLSEQQALEALGLAVEVAHSSSSGHAKHRKKERS